MDSPGHGLTRLTIRRLSGIAAIGLLLGAAWWARTPPGPAPPSPAEVGEGTAPAEAALPGAAPVATPPLTPPPVGREPIPEAHDTPASPTPGAERVRSEAGVSGVVVAESGEGVGGARVVITSQDGAVAGAEAQRVVSSGADGTFWVDGLRSRKVALQAMHDDYWWCEPVQVAPPSRDVVLTLQLGGVIDGTVFDEVGRTRSRALVALEGGGRSRRTQTDDNGQFRFQGLAYAQYEIVVLSRDLRADEQGGAPAVPEKTRWSVEVGPGSYENVEVRLRDRP